MAATPKGGTAIFKGLSSGTTYYKAFYNTDVSNALVRFDAGGGQPASATTGTDFVTFDEAVALIDVSCVTGVVDCGSLRIVANNVPTGSVLLIASHLNTLNNRPSINVGFQRGSRVGLMSVLPAA